LVVIPRAEEVHCLAACRRAECEVELDRGHCVDFRSEELSENIRI
jgi:hypothetical protein